MPVEVVFHSDLIDNVEHSFKQSTVKAHPRLPIIPVYSAYRAGQVDFEADNNILSFLWGCSEGRSPLSLADAIALSSRGKLRLTRSQRDGVVLQRAEERLSRVQLVNPFGSSVTSIETIRGLLRAEDRQPEDVRSAVA